MNQSRTYIKYRFCPHCGSFNLLMFQSPLSMPPMDYYIHVPRTPNTPPICYLTYLSLSYCKLSVIPNENARSMQILAADTGTASLARSFYSLKSIMVLHELITKDTN